ncbi:MAG: hypothetical protein K5829_13570 [Treponema sp.]|nr:hypothetical protein [Treponema sp.]
MKKIFSVLFSIIFAICLLFTLLLAVIRNNVSYSSLVKMAGNMMKPVAAAPVEDGLFHPGDIRYSLADYEDSESLEFGNFDIDSLDLSSVDLSNMDINEIVQSYLEASGVDVEPEFIAEVFSTPEVSEFVDQYVGEVVGYMTGSTKELTINPDDVVKVMNKSLDMYEEYTGEKIDRSGMEEAIEKNVSQVKATVEETLNQVKEENSENLEVLKQLEFFLSMKFFLICIAITLFFALIIFVINRNLFVWLKYVFMPVFIDGLILFIAACILQGILPGIIKNMLADYSLPKGIFEGIWSLLAALLGQLKLCGIIAAIAGIALWTCGFTLGKRSLNKAA